MVRTIEISRGTEWSAATWLYDLALTITAEHVHTPALALRLTEVVDSNFGWINLADYTPEERHEIAATMREFLMPVSEQRLPTTVPNRDHALELLRDLADMAGNTTGSDS